MALRNCAASFSAETVFVIPDTVMLLQHESEPATSGV